VGVVTVTVIGLDGRPLDPGAAKALAEATLLVGAERHLAAVDAPGAARTLALGELERALDALSAHAGPAVVLASGDPGFFGIVRSLRARGLAPVVFPAVSSVAQAFARQGLTWDDALVVSAHGRALAPAVNACRAHPKVAVLTGPSAGPAELGAALVNSRCTLVVAERLGSPDERVVTCTPSAAAALDWRDPNVVLVLGPGAGSSERGWRAPRESTPPGWALPEDAFEHRDGMITKAEVRALVLARLAPRTGDLIWDVGAGSGSVGVECARFGAAVIAIEKDPDAAALVARNAARHEVSVEVVAGSAPAALTELPDPDAIFIGCGSRVAGACARRGARTVVVTLATVDGVAEVRELLTASGYAVDGALIQASRLALLGAGGRAGTRLAATNPVFVLWGDRL
jgi:precorrin-6Y C5,15-methyltransferase (decarboxylating)